MAVEGDVVWSHRLTPRPMIHQELPPRSSAFDICLHVVVNPSGQVESAKAENVYNSADKWAVSEAVTAEKSQRFRPFIKNGRAVRAAFDDCVWIVPPVQWASPRVPFPAIHNWDTLRIRLSRTGCYGVCPAYSVEIRGDGEVLFDGEQNVLVIGHHRSRIPRDGVAGLVAAFRNAGYFSLKDEYVATITDNPTCTTSIEFDGHKKSLKDYVGFAAGMPEIVMDLEGKIDQVAGTDKWIRDTPQTAPSSLSEGWNFKADTPENLDLFAHAIQWKANRVVDLFIQHGAPTLEAPPKDISALEAAASIGNVPLVSRFMHAAHRLSPSLLACALDAAARSGSLSTVRLLIANGAHVNGPLCERGGPPLIAAAYSGKPAVVDEILKYGPDVNAKDSSGDTALSAFLGRSLFQSHALQIVAALVHAGADLSFRDDQGRTAAEMALEQGDTKAAAFLESAAKVRKRGH
jgi:hypothetical protein